MPSFAQSTSQPACAEKTAIRAACEAGLYHAFPVGAGHLARNPGQRWVTRFDDRGFTTTPDAGSWSWGLDLLRYGWGVDLRAVSSPTAVIPADERVSRAWDGQLTEWYVNDRRGLEHGYTVRSRSADSQGCLALELSTRGDLRPEVSADARDVRFLDATGAAVLTYAGLAVFDADGKSLPGGWQAHGSLLRLHIDDTGARYPLVIDPIAQQAYLKASNTDAADEWGHSVAISGDTAVVSSGAEASNATGTNGNQADNSMPYAGAAYVFVRSGATWVQQAYLKASNTEANDQFGVAVAISGDTIVVGARLEASAATGVNGNQADNSASQAGAAYVFVRTGTTWSQQAYLKASNTAAGAWFGYSVAASGETIVVGAPQLSSMGAAYVFVRTGTTWSQQAFVQASNPDQGDRFGWSLAVDGGTLVVGAPWESSNARGVGGNQANNLAPASGAAYVFVRSGAVWSQQVYLKSSNSDASDWFGSAVAVAGDTVAVGAWGEDSNARSVNGNQGDNSAIQAGAAYVFVRSGTTWSQQAYVKASNTDADDQFGAELAISGNTLVVAGYGEDSSATGVNGNQGDNSASSAGAVYVFVRIDATWSQHAYLKASNTDALDKFGFAVALAHGSLFVGAPHERSNATGVNGNQFDNSLIEAGAAYAFELGLNDECALAVPLTLGVNGGVRTVGATTSSPPMSCGAGGSDLWFSFTPDCTAPHTFDTCGVGTNFNTVIELYGGTCGALTSIACNDDACGTSSSLTAPLTLGTTYWLRLGGAGSATGTADLRVSTGTGTGRIAPSTTVSQCPSPATLRVTGDPNIGNTVVIDVLGATGLPLVGFGFTSLLPLPLPCGCAAISDGAGGLGFFQFNSRLSLTIPCQSFLIGVQFTCQGIDVLPTSGGCTIGVRFGLTDVWTVSIG